MKLCLFIFVAIIIAVIFCLLNKNKKKKNQVTSDNISVPSDNDVTSDNISVPSDNDVTFEIINSTKYSLSSLRNCKIKVKLIGSFHDWGENLDLIVTNDTGAQYNLNPAAYVCGYNRAELEVELNKNYTYELSRKTKEQFTIEKIEYV